VARDFRFCDGFRDAVGSVCRNISEGFTRYRSADILQFFDYALASLAETTDYILECHLRKAIGDTDRDRLLDDCNHTRAMMLRFMRPHRNTHRRRRPRTR
jgi:four helix bundle protein